ncbi:MAG: hypothetical protein GY834_06330 [Bacteroidetes bacterium]|nr:hypothetical protein [Bacteroidota bacterium]
MADLTTTYLGLKFKNLIVAASSGLTEDINAIIELEKEGTSAIALKPIFEKKITLFMRWISIMSRRAGCDLAASTGIHDGKPIIKQLLARTSVVQIASTLYNNGLKHINIMLKELNDWMDRTGFVNLNQFRGLLSQVSSSNPSAYERVQFMKYFSGKF